MKTTKTYGILLGLSVLSSTSLLGIVQPAHAAPAGFSEIQYRRPYRGTYQVLTGRVTRNYAGNGFLLITDRGSTYRVTVLGGEPRRLSVGDRVQVSGTYRGGSFRAERFTMLRDR